MSQVLSKDGTPIAYERSGSGPALILIDGALCSRAFGPSPKLAPLLMLMRCTCQAAHRRLSMLDCSTWQIQLLNGCLTMPSDKQ